MAKKKIIINHKEFEMPKVGVKAYRNYLAVRDQVMGTEEKNGLYTGEQFDMMLDCICEMYGNQFTVDDLIDSEGGLSVSEIVMEFASIDIGIANEVNAKVERAKENFTNGK